MNKNKTDVVIISYNTLNHTLECLKSLYNTAQDIINNIIVVDNASSDGTIEAVKRQYPNVIIIINQENLGYAKAVNIGVKAGTTEFIVISNPDVIYHENSISKLINYFNENPETGAVGPQQLYPDGSYQYSYGDLPGIRLGLKKLILINHLQDYFDRRNWARGKTNPKYVPYIDGAVIATKRTAYTEANGFDEDYFFYTEEADYCYKLKNNGWQIVHNPSSVVTHFRGATNNSIGLNENRLRQMISSKSKFSKKHLSFQSGKFYMICEIVYSLNMTTIWSIKHLLSKIFQKGTGQQSYMSEKEQQRANKEMKPPKSKTETSMKKVAYNKLMFHIWLDEFNNYLRSNEK